MVRRGWGHGAPLRLEVGTPGMLDTLRFVEDPISDLAAHEVDIRQTVCPISFRDVFIALGKLGKEPPGFECAGAVTRVGTIASKTFAPGDHVLMISPGCMRSHPRASANAVLKIPDDLMFEDPVAGINLGQQGKSPGAIKRDHAHMFRQSEKPQRLVIVAEAMRYKMARTLSVEPSETDLERNLAAYGIDSLMAVELRNWLGKDIVANLTVFEVMGAAKVDDVAKLVVERAHV